LEIHRDKTFIFKTSSNYSPDALSQRSREAIYMLKPEATAGMHCTIQPIAIQNYEFLMKLSWSWIR